MPYTWTDVYDIICQVADNSNTHDWCLDLVNGDIEDKRLAVCLAIEVKYGLLNSNHLNIIFGDCDYEKGKITARMWFARKLDSVRDHIKKAGGCVIESNEYEAGNCNRHVTFLTFYRLWKFYLRELDIFSGIDVASEDEIEDFIKSNPYLLNELEYFGNYKKNVIWITSAAEIDRIRVAGFTYSPPTCFMNELGLTPDDEGISYFSERGKMCFLVEYPEDFSETVYQPTSLNKNWEHVSKDIYLSNKRDNKCGLTYATDGCLKCAREQIHEPVECKDKKFSIRYIGKHTNLPFDKSKIADLGLSRL